MAAKEHTKLLNPHAVKGDTRKQLLLGLLFGMVFGFLLQKGGVAKFEILIGVLLLQDYTVIQVMLSAIIVGMVGVLGMHRLGLVELQLKPTRYGANIVGGLIFGLGFGLAAYCPGTGAAALGQGNFDAFAFIVGMFGGSYIWALTYPGLDKKLGSLGDRGKISLAEVAGVPGWAFATGFWLFLVAVLVAVAFLPTLPPA